MIHRLLVLVVAVTLTICAFTLAAGNGPGAETILWAPGAGEGLTSADWPIGVLWLLGLGTCGALVVRRPQPALIAAPGVLLTFFTLTLLKGDGPDSGHTILAFGPGNGINSGDVPLIVVWVVGVAACVTALILRSRRYT